MDQLVWIPFMGSREVTSPGLNNVEQVMMEQGNQDKQYPMWVSYVPSMLPRLSSSTERHLRHCFPHWVSNCVPNCETREEVLAQRDQFKLFEEDAFVAVSQRLLPPDAKL